MSKAAAAAAALTLSFKFANAHSKTLICKPKGKNSRTWYGLHVQTIAFHPNVVIENSINAIYRFIMSRSTIFDTILGDIAVDVEEMRRQ